MAVFSYILSKLCEKEDEGMTDGNIYKSIAERTGGEIYAGVVGPVRTGKSTFIKRFIVQSLKSTASKRKRIALNITNTP